jgi:hypothetical protein
MRKTRPILLVVSVIREESGGRSQESGVRRKKKEFRMKEFRMKEESR